MSNNLISTFHKPKEHSNFIKILLWGSYRSFVSPFWCCSTLTSSTPLIRLITLELQSKHPKFCNSFFRLPWSNRAGFLWRLWNFHPQKNSELNWSGPDQPDPVGHANKRPGQARSHQMWTPEVPSNQNYSVIISTCSTRASCGATQRGQKLCIASKESEWVSQHTKETGNHQGMSPILLE